MLPGIPQIDSQETEEEGGKVCTFLAVVGNGLLAGTMPKALRDNGRDVAAVTLEGAQGLLGAGAFFAGKSTNTRIVGASALASAVTSVSAEYLSPFAGLLVPAKETDTAAKKAETTEDDKSLEAIATKQIRPAVDPDAVEVPEEHHHEVQLQAAPNGVAARTAT